MAVDEVLLESAIADGGCTLRWYTWDGPTVSLGYFQTADGAGDDVRLRGLPVVRRLSGGGAIVHHHELTYSCILSPAHPLVRRPHDLYLAVHHAIIGRFRVWGVPLALRGEETATGAGDSTFLCFSRGDPCDVVLGGRKVLGSAQRRRRGAVLQHGSLVLRGSPHAPQFPGLWDLAPPAALAGEGLPDPGQLSRLLTSAVLEALELDAEPGELSASEHERARELTCERYGNST